MKRFPLLVLATLLCGTSLARAQMGQVYYGAGGYPAAAPAMPYGGNRAPVVYRQPVQRVQYPYNYYANYPRAGYTPAPVYYPQQQAAQYGYNTGYGVNYQYVNNPIGVSPTPAPYSAVANQRALERTGTWPVPSGAGTVVESDPVIEAYEEGTGPTPGGPIIPYHRTPSECVWFSADYVAAYIRPMRLAGPLLTTGSALDPRPGALGRASTAVLFGNDTVNFNLMSGVRSEIGMFMDETNRVSLELAGFYLIPSNQSYDAASDTTGSPVLSRPIFNVSAAAEGAFVNSIPNTIAGDIHINFRSELFGAELNARYHSYVKERFHLDGLLGFRYLRLAERLRVDENIHNVQPNFATFLGNSIGPSDSLTDFDQFSTTNQFFGPQIGGRVSWEHQWFTATGFAKLALGATQQNTSIVGTTTLNSPAGNQIVQGGILALPSNIGTHSRTVFGVLPEFGLNLGVNLTQCVRVRLGYSLLLWNKVVRPGGQYDLNINPGQVPGSQGYNIVNGPFAPTYRYNDEFFFIHSLNLGVEVHY